MLCLCNASFGHSMTKVFASYWHLLLFITGYTPEQTRVESYHDMFTLKKVVLI